MTLFINGAQAQQTPLSLYAQLPSVDSFSILPANDNGVGAHVDVFTLDFSGMPLEGESAASMALMIRDNMLAARAEERPHTMQGAPAVHMLAGTCDHACTWQDVYYSACFREARACRRRPGESLFERHVAKPPATQQHVSELAACEGAAEMRTALCCGVGLVVLG